MARRACVHVAAWVAAALSGAVPAAHGRTERGGVQPRRLAADAFLVLEDLPAGVLARQAAEPGRARPQRYVAVHAPLALIRAGLADVEREPLGGTASVGTVYTLPDPEGGAQTFLLYETQLMEPDLAAQLPTVRTYVGTGLDDPTAALRLTVAETGLTAQVLSEHGAWYVDPAARGDSDHYVVHRKGSVKAHRLGGCVGEDLSLQPEMFAQAGGAGVAGPAGSNGATLRTYRAAIAATGEYTAFHGGTVAQAQAAIVATMNRVVGVFERDLAIRMTLVNNAAIVYTDAASDPYTDTTNLTQMLGQNQTAIDGAIGNSGYNIGHVFSVVPGGVATVSQVCRTGQKARGVSGFSPPTGDDFDVRLACHEMGHQFGARHTFNGTGGSCLTNRNAATSFEPGSGSTIMGYAGICGVDDLQLGPDDNFHSMSIEAILTYIGTVACQTSAATGNGVPTVAPGGAHVVPRLTPFTLTASASDPDGDALTYSWEQRDAGGADGEPLSAADSGVGPLFRARAPVADPSRTFPRMSDILLNANVSASEELPGVARTLNFRVMVRDNKAGGGATNTTDATVQVAGTAGPFSVVYPNGGEVLSATQTVSWLVNGTSVAPINAQFVNILLSLDGGATYPHTLATAVPNTGSATVLIPEVSSDSGRVRVEAAGNIFFDVSDGNCRVRPPPAGVVLAGIGIETLSDADPNGNGNGRIDPGENAIGVTVSIINVGGDTATGVTGTLESLTPTVTVVQGATTWPDLSLNESAPSETPVVIAVDAAHACGAPITLRLHLDSAEPFDPTTYEFVLSTGLPGGLSPTPVTFTYAGPAVPIPDRESGVDGEVQIPFVISGVGALGSIEFAFTGTECSTALGATTVGLDHSWPGDLVITLINPGGTEVNLADNPGPVPLGSSGRNFCNTTFVQGTGVPSIQSITPADAPYSQSYAPAQSFNALIGQNGSGTWTLRVRDTQAVDVGSVRSFRLTLRSQTGTSCAAPGPSPCSVDYNLDGVVNPDDLGDFITEYFTEPPIPGPGGYAIACPENEAPYDQGYKAAFVPPAAGSGQCFPPFPDNLGDFIAAYFEGGC